MPATKIRRACTIYKNGMGLPIRLDKKTVSWAKISPKIVNPEDITGNAGEEEGEGEAEEEEEEEEEEGQMSYFVIGVSHSAKLYPCLQPG